MFRVVAKGPPGQNVAWHHSLALPIDALGWWASRPVANFSHSQALPLSPTCAAVFIIRAVIFSSLRQVIIQAGLPKLNANVGEIFQSEKKRWRGWEGGQGRPGPGRKKEGREGARWGGQLSGCRSVTDDTQPWGSAVLVLFVQLIAVTFS